jgi:hypothetical protein
MATQPVMPFAAAAPQSPMGFGQFSMQGNMSAQNAALLMAALGQLSPQQISALMQLAAVGQLNPQGVMQMAAQLQLTPAQLNALLPFLSGITAATPPNTGTAFAAANPAAPPVAPAGSPAAPAAGGTPAPATGAATPPPASTVGRAAAPARPLSPVELQEQIRLAEQRLKELDELRSRAQN